MKKNQIDIITLGCSKNLVDSELLMKQFEANGYHCVHDSKRPQGEIAVINTCGFIGDAKQESIDTILEFVQRKQEGKVRKLYVMGCLSQRYQKELEAEMDALMAKAKDGELEESFKTLKSDSLKREKAGVAKAGLAMPRPTKIDTDAKMGTSAGDSKGKAVPKTVSKRIESPSEQVLKWKPIPKHNPKAASAKSVIG